MPDYVLSFRGRPGAVPSAEEEAAWPAWFGRLGGAVGDMGHRVGRVRLVGDGAAFGEPRSVLTGYVVITAENLEHAVALAGGCPGLASGGWVEVGEAVPPG